jgi:hypothetical protein
MAFSFVRKRYNGIKDSSQPQIGGNIQTTAKEVSGQVVNDDPATLLNGNNEEHVQERSSSLSEVTEKDTANATAATVHRVDSNEFADDDPAVRDIPWTVRKIVSLHDDPTLPTLTFRYFLLTFIFVIPGAFLSQMSKFRTTYAPYSTFFVQIAANYTGLWLAKVLPATVVRVPFTKYSFSLNPGPWSIKELVLVTISAASGATWNLAR